MANAKTRVLKAPEERKQEIMDVAMRVFTENGYERTTMRDIAAAVGVVPGLCYRYFASKQDLFDEAVKQYVSDFCAPIVQALKQHSGDFAAAMKAVADLFLHSGDREKYDTFYHQQENKAHHLLLYCYNCDYLLPFVTEFFDSLNEAGTAAIPDTLSFSRFILYGQIPIMEDDTLPMERKVELINSFILKLLH